MGKSKEEMEKINKNTRFTTGSVAVENGKKGGIASAKAKQEAKLIKNIITGILN